MSSNSTESNFESDGDTDPQEETRSSPANSLSSPRTPDNNSNSSVSDHNSSNLAIQQLKYNVAKYSVASSMTKPCITAELTPYHTHLADKLHFSVSILELPFTLSLIQTGYFKLSLGNFILKWPRKVLSLPPTSKVKRIYSPILEENCSYLKFSSCLKVIIC